MQANPQPFAFRPKLEEKDFTRISKFIQDHVGIKLPIAKLILVESRLIKRLMKLNLKSFSEYVEFVFSKEGNHEKGTLIDFLCTNKTDFFREDVHFRFLEKHISALKTSQLNIWSAACSSGEEPYTISMVLDRAKKDQLFTGHYSIFASDISTSILEKAMAGEYAVKSLENTPAAFRKSYFNITGNVASINAEIKRPVSFGKFNLIDDAAYTKLKTFDIIFCRNVLIYFDRDKQIKVIQNLIDRLVPGGILFLGHSETLMGKTFPVKQIQPTIYQKLYA
jgi:chemotaxis protein methyltransferase CheR